MKSDLTNLGQLRMAVRETGRVIAETAEAAARDIEAVAPAVWTVTLPAAGWAGSGPYFQAASVPGALADEEAQLVQIAPASASRAAYREAGVECDGQGDGTLTFTAQKKPDGSLKIFVILQALGMGGMEENAQEVQV